MAKILVLLESPRKVEKINKYLNKLNDGNKYTVIATEGHFVELADVGISKVGIKDLDTMEPEFSVIEGKKELVSKIKKMIKDYELILLASDPDREGECIAYHCIQQFNIPKSKARRVKFHEITESGIKQGIANMGQLDEKMVDSAICRAIMDKCIGFRLSPLLWFSVGGKSAGRCQSAALYILAELEKKIKVFIPEEFFEIDLKIKKDKIYQCKFIGEENKKYQTIDTEEKAKKIIDELKFSDFKVIDISHREKYIHPKPAFTTSTVQQAASTSFGMSPKSSASRLSELYTDSLITYIRTDSTRLSPEFVEAAKKYIIETYGKEYYKGYYHKEDKNSQNAHEALRPTDLYIENNDRLYQLIKARALASLMQPCKIKTTTITLKNDKYLFTLTGNEILEDGYLKAYSYKEEDESDDNNTIPNLSVGEIVNVHSLTYIKKETQPPKRYSEAGMIKELEKLGIGRPSTYTSIIETLKDRNYIKVENRSITVTDKGIKVSDYLTENFSNIINVGFTAEMEKLLDEIAEGKADRVQSLKDFWEVVKKALSDVRKKQAEKPKEEKKYVIVGKCPQCDGDLVEREGKFGKFVGCKNYPKCKYIRKKEKPKENVITDNLNCPKCKKGKLIQKEGKGKKFWSCDQFPSCNQTFNLAQYNKFKEGGTIPESYKKTKKKGK